MFSRSLHHLPDELRTEQSLHNLHIQRHVLTSVPKWHLNIGCQALDPSYSNVVFHV